MRTPIKHGTATFSKEPTQEQVDCVEKVAEYFYDNPKRKPKLRHHRFRFGFLGNLKVLICRIFGHRINNDKNYHSCQRCRLAYEEIYENYYE